MSFTKKSDALKVEGLSMGCAVEQPVCRVPGCTGGDHAHLVYEDTNAPQLMWVSVVNTPKCGSCNAEMKPTFVGLDWVCQNDACEKFGISIPLGIGYIVPDDGQG